MVVRLAGPMPVTLTAGAQRWTEPDRQVPRRRRPRGFRAVRFAELLTRPPIPRHLKSSSWGNGFFVRPSPGSSGDCPMPTPPGSPPPPHDRSRRVQALAVPATAPCPEPLGFPDRVMVVPAGSEPWPFRQRHHARNPWRLRSSRTGSSPDPSPGSSGDCRMPMTPGVPKSRAATFRRTRGHTAPAPLPDPAPLASPRRTLPIQRGSEPWAIQRHVHLRRSSRVQTS